MHDEMRAVMNVIYAYALAADDNESTQSARHVTEGNFCESITRAFFVVSPRVLKAASEEGDFSAKRPLSALLKLATYVAEDNAEGKIPQELRQKKMSG